MYSSTFCCAIEYFCLDLALYQSLANQVSEQAEFLHRTGEDIQLTADQSLQLEQMAALERSFREQSEKVKLLEARVDTLEQDNSALKEKASKLQEKVKVAAKEKKGIFFFLLCPSSSFLCSHVFFALTELKSLLLRKDNDVTDLTNCWCSLSTPFIPCLPLIMA